MARLAYPDGWIGAAAAMYLVIVPAALAVVILARAVERSAVWEVIGWAVLAAPCIPAFLKYRRDKDAREMWQAVILEKSRRG